MSGIHAEGHTPCSGLWNNPTYRQLRVCKLWVARPLSTSTLLKVHGDWSIVPGVSHHLRCNPKVMWRGKPEGVWQLSLWLQELLPKPGSTKILLPYADKFLAVSPTAPPFRSADLQEQLRVAVLPCGLNHSLGWYLFLADAQSCIPRVSIRGFTWKRHRCKLQKAVPCHAGLN